MHPFYRILLCCMAPALLLASCGGNPKETGTTAVSQEAAGKEAPLSGNFYKRMEGTIADQPVVMQLHCYNGSMDGSYYYVKQGKPITLSGVQDSLHPNNLMLTEMDEAGNSSGKLEGVFERGTVKGSWRSADGTKSYLIDLREAYPAGSYAFTTMALEATAKAVPGSDSSPVATVTKEVLVPADNGSDGQWLAAQITTIISGDNAARNTSIIATAKASNQAFIADYNAEVKENAGPEMQYSATLNYEDYQHLAVLYNEHGFVTVEKNFYGYTGGAHGLGGSLYYCLDVEGKKRLQLSDVITADSAQLQLVVEAAYRKQNGLRATDSLNDNLFDNHLATTTNFYFTPTGLGFLYLPYEVMPYAAGTLSVFVSYRELSRYLQPQFVKRMKL